MSDPKAPASGNGAAEHDYRDPRLVVRLFDEAAAANLESSLRKGSTAHLPASGDLLMTGDLHDHAANLEKILKLADLKRGPQRHLILHEIIHGRNRVNGRDFSVRLLARVAALKVEFPDQVHLLQANHELAQLGGEGILKDGVSVVEAFDQGLDYLYRDESETVRAAMTRFIRSLLLAVRCPNGVFCSHSLPSPRRLASFDEMVIHRVPTTLDLSVGGSAYDMVWGRNHNQMLSDELSDAWDADLFIMGHQPADYGHETEGDSMLVLASDHEHGVALPIDLSQRYDLQGLVDRLIPLAGVRVGR